jgi:hypothetical protein
MCAVRKTTKFTDQIADCVIVVAQTLGVIGAAVASAAIYTAVFALPLGGLMALVGAMVAMARARQRRAVGAGGDKTDRS